MQRGAGGAHGRSATGGSVSACELPLRLSWAGTPSHPREEGAVHVPYHLLPPFLSEDGIMSYRRKGVRSTSKNFLMAFEEGALLAWGWLALGGLFSSWSTWVCFPLKDVDKLDKIQGKDNKNDVLLGETENNSL